MPFTKGDSVLPKFEEICYFAIFSGNLLTESSYSQLVTICICNGSHQKSSCNLLYDKSKEVVKII